VGECVLIVDDQATHRLFARIVLEAEGYEVLEAGDARSAERVLLVSRPRLALVDIDLPDACDFEVAERLRRASCAELRVVAFTAHEGAPMRERARAAGFDGYISKPIDSRALVARVASYLGVTQEKKG